jgi:DNA-binding LacI/PurR family transcriptional regulator
MRQIAEKVNVSPMTVSRVLRGQPGQASAQTVERILNASRDLSYIPVRSGLQNKHQETRIISVVFEGSGRDCYFNPLDITVYEGLCRAAAQHRYDLLNLLRADSDWVLDDEELRYLDRRSDGAIFISSQAGHRQKALEALASHNIPTVVFGRRDVPDGVAWIDANSQSVSKLAVEHLIAKGHRRIAFLSGPDDRYDRQQRRLAFSATMRANGLEEFASAIVLAVKPDFSLDEKVALNILEMKATAIICVTDAAAFQLWELLEKHGLRVPEDLSIVGVDNTPESRWRGLTTVDISLSQAGQFVLEAWMALRNGENFRQCCQTLPSQFIERTSVLALH